ncbi:MAG TPA: hypothetical protein PK725_01185 [Rhodocyclaceae bacterium]|nr:hypothetical protein [Rhodocyclaceae bacterium]
MLSDLSQFFRVEDDDKTVLAFIQLSNLDKLSREDFPDGKSSSRGKHTGRVVLKIGDENCFVDASFVQSIYINRTGKLEIDIGLKVPSPIPGFLRVDTIDILLKCLDGVWVVEIPKFGWFENGSDLKGGFNSWLRVGGGDKDVKLKGAEFPLGQLGVAIENHVWPRKKLEVPGGSAWSVVMGRVGLFLNERSPYLIFLPSVSGNSKTEFEVPGGLKLLGLEGVNVAKTTGSHEYLLSYAPVLLFIELGGTNSARLWNVPVGWALWPEDKVFPESRLLLSHVLQPAWNEAVRLAARGNLVERAGTPYLPLPTLAITGDGDRSKSYPILLFDIPRPSADKASAQARLRRIHVCGESPGRVTATFRFQATAIGLAGDTAASDPKYPDRTRSSHLPFYLKLDGDFRGNTKLPLTFAPAIIDTPGMEVSDIIQAAGISGPEQDELLLDTTIELTSGSLASHGDENDTSEKWLTWGSLEFGLPESLEAENGNPSTLRLMLRGEWAEHHRNLYPEIDLRLHKVKVRFSAAVDLSGADLSAAFDAESDAEDRLHRDTAALIHRFGGEPIECDLRIRHKTMPGRNAVTRLEVRSTKVSGKWGPKALHVQLRPFMVAQTEPPSLDAEAGELIAVWSSDDGEGAQWRLPDANVEVFLPPQAVGETMERGVRFWGEDDDKPSPEVNPEKVLRFRFSPPTELTLRPSLQPRRYNRSPANVAKVLEQARVTSFVTEIAYPIQTTFKASGRDALPDVRVKETVGYIGRTGQNLPTRSFSVDVWSAEDIADVKGHIRDLLAKAPADYLTGLIPEALTNAGSDEALDQPPQELQRLLKQLNHMASAHTANRRNFAARLAQYHLYDPFRPDGALALFQGLSFRIRDTEHGAAPLRNPLPKWSLDRAEDSQPRASAIGTDLSPKQKDAIEKFLDEEATTPPNWFTNSEGVGLSILGGVVHTIEFASELMAVLSKPESDIGAIDHLAFTALGANASFHCAFDEGRTVFYAESQHGQLSRLLKVRIGRLGVLWNKARHVVVYERSTVPSVQFKGEQEYKREVGSEPGQQSACTGSRGWPILRKTEEYIEPVEPLRAFGAERQKDGSHTAFIEASEVVSARIYVNGAWGRDLAHGYEIPLWNPEDGSGFYPKPELALWGQAGDGNCSRLWLRAPQHVFFYTSTEPNTGADPDQWEAKPGVDCPVGLHRLPARAPRNPSPAEVRTVLDQDRLPSPRPTSLSRPRFDFAVLPAGKVNLQHGRADSEMLIDLELVALMRSDSAAAPPLDQSTTKDDWEKIVTSVQRAEQLAAAADMEGRIRSKLRQAFDRLRSAPGQCDAIKKEITDQINHEFGQAKVDLERALDRLGPTLTLPKLSTQAAVDIQRQLLAMETALHVPFGVLRRDIASLREALAGLDAEQTEEIKKLRLAALSQWQAGKALIDGVFEQALERLKLVNQALELNADNKHLEGFKNAIGKLKHAIEKPNKNKIVSALSKAQVALQNLSNHRLLGKTAAELARLLQTVRALVDSGVPVAEIKESLHKLSTNLDAFARALQSKANDLSGDLGKIRTTVSSQLEDIRGNLDTPNAKIELDIVLRGALTAIDNLAASAEATVEQRESTVVGGFRNIVSGAAEKAERQAEEVDKALEQINDGFAELLKGFKDKLGNVFADSGAIGKIKKNALKLIRKVDCTSLEILAQAEANLIQTLEQAGDRIRDAFTGYASDLLDAEARQRLAELELAVASSVQLADKAGSAIKLARALGDLPALPTLSFNLDRAEYFFEDARKTIETSPFAAKLREVDAGLKELGLAVPCRQLLDQMVPDSIKGLDFNQVFRNVGGIDFQRLFKRFKLPEVSSDRVRVTHGLDKVTRTAWVRSRVDFAHDKPESLFDLAGFVLRIDKLRLLASNEVRVTANGERTSVTDAKFTGDWALHFSGTDLARFREITVRYDGSRPDFDFSPDKLELHPSLKLLTDVTSRLSANVPPGVEVLKDGRGKPIGVKAGVTNQWPGMDLPPLAIGPMTIAAGLSLQVDGAQGALHIASHLSVGSRQEPVWIQIGYLGGGLWLEARASYVERVRYSASVGMALGAARSFSLGSVARGSFALLLFVYLEVEDSGGSLRAGFSIAGSARILGIANASVLLLMEVEHRGGRGGSRGRGILDVKIRISRFYKIHVHRQVEKQIGS